MADTSTWTRWAPLTGVLAPVLWIIGVFISESGDVPDEKSTAPQILTYFEEDTNSILLGGSIFLFGILLFILFITVLRGRWRAGGEATNAPALAYGTGMLGAGFLAALWAPQMAIAVATMESDVQLQPATAEVGWHIGLGFIILAEFLLALFLFATAAASMRAPVLPKWLAWAGVAIGVVALIPPIGWMAIIFAFPLWVLVAGIVVTVQTTRGAPARQAV